jgi:hypothetical protein
MSLLKVTCRKCGESTKLDTCDKSREEVEKWLKKDDDGFQCFGNHVEFGSRADYWTIDWNSEEEGHAPTEEDFLAELKSKYSEVYDTQELQKFYEVVGFFYGMCTSKSKATNVEKVFDFVRSPKGTRYYIF